MELTAKEIEAFRGIERQEKSKKLFAWNLLFGGVVLFANDAGGDWFATSDVSFSVVFLLAGTFLLCATYFQPSSNDRLLRLLQRYVNSDAQALMQLTESRSSSSAT